MANVALRFEAVPFEGALALAMESGSLVSISAAKIQVDVTVDDAVPDAVAACIASMGAAGWTHIATDPSYPVRSGLDMPPSYVHGLQLSWVSVTQVQVSGGGCRDSEDESDIVAATALTADITVSGAGGLDAGVEAVDTWYAVHAIAGSGQPVALLLSASATAPSLPAGYTHFRRLGWVRNNAAGDFRVFHCEGTSRARRYDHFATSRAEMTALNAGITGTWAALDLSGFVPPSSTRLGAWSYGNSYTYTEFRPTGTTLANGDAVARVESDDIGFGGGALWMRCSASQSVDVRRQNSSAGHFLTFVVQQYEDDL